VCNDAGARDRKCTRHITISSNADACPQGNARMVILDVEDLLEETRVQTSPLNSQVLQVMIELKRCFIDDTRVVLYESIGPGLSKAGRKQLIIAHSSSPFHGSHQAGLFF
jgi:hypothetical protein